MAQTIDIALYKTNAFLDSYSQSGSMDDPIFPKSSVTWDGEAGQVRDIQLYAQNDGNIDAFDVVVEVVDTDGTDETTWSKLASTQAGLSGATVGGDLSIGNLAVGANTNFWLRIQVPVGASSENKTDLRLRAAASWSSSSSSCSSSQSSSSSSSSSNSLSSQSSSSSSSSSSSQSSESISSSSSSSSSLEAGLIDHGALAGLGDDDHTQYLLASGARELTGDWDIGDGRYIAGDTFRARDAAGLKLYDDGGNGIFVKDGGQVGIGTTTFLNAGTPLHIKDANASSIINSVLENTGSNGSAQFQAYNDNAKAMSVGIWGSPAPIENMGFLYGGGAGLILGATNSGLGGTNAIEIDSSENVVINETLAFDGIGTTVNEFSTDGTLGGNSDDAVPTEKAVKTYVDGAVSARRYKTKIRNMENIGWLMGLRPVNYEAKTELGRKRYGFIAEEVEGINNLLVFYNEEGQPEGIYYKELIPVLVKFVQEQQTRIEQLETICQNLH